MHFCYSWNGLKGNLILELNKEKKDYKYVYHGQVLFYLNTFSKSKDVHSLLNS